LEGGDQLALRYGDEHRHTLAVDLACASVDALIGGRAQQPDRSDLLTPPPFSMPLPLQLALTMKDGTTAFLDLERNAFLTPYRIPNVWAQQEDRLKRSGMPVPARPRP
jgi:hypothetical protein